MTTPSDAPAWAAAGRAQRGILGERRAGYREALTHGRPPHSSLAISFDHWVACLVRSDDRFGRDGPLLARSVLLLSVSILGENRGLGVGGIAVAVVGLLGFVPSAAGRLQVCLCVSGSIRAAWNDWLNVQPPCGAW
jgi:hypothetical protein